MNNFQLPTSTPQVDSLTTDSAKNIISADSALNIPDPSDYTVGDTFIYIWDLLQVQLFTIQNTPVTFLKLLIFVLLIIGFSFLASFVKRMLNNRILPKFVKDSGLRYTLSRMSQYVVVVIGVFISFQFLGINMTGLAVIFGFLSVGIGFGLQNITSNFISGLIVLFERPISVGDRVSVNNIEGDIQEINIRSTKVKTLDNISIIVPNSEFVSKDVINFSHGDTSYRLSIDVGVSYSSVLDLVLKALNEVAEESDDVLKHPEHDVHLRSFGDSAWDMKLLVWIPDVKKRYQVQNTLNQAIVRKFAEYDIEIPFPQRDLHVRSGLDMGNKEVKHGSEDSETDSDKSEP
ncbi:mechanosensitive ion channel family protein [Gracilimonas amylolytica]|uniref:mechanosensitive ion channel family protein n=1 Tax=Gracilimonas amylolytica TaxID=1749045 RepID=UPI000CD85E2A|nr:mechanosensitive ion channel domain-containing protein [Gracilimonas amylolytica]